jgi:hypothetical protein
MEIDMTKIYTARDARAEKQAYNDKVNARIDAAEAAEAEIKAILRANPQIGVLNNGKFYVCIASGKYREANHPSKLI